MTTPIRTLATLATAVAFAVAVVTLATCAGDDDRAAPGEGRGRVTALPEADVLTPGAPIDEALMVPLAQAKNFHRKARVYMTDGNLDEAIRAIRQILALEFPAGAPEGEDVRLDAHAMLAKLLLAQGKHDDAMAIVGEGIGAATRESFFLANLHTVAGEVWEARAAALDAEGTDLARERARAARRAAIDAYDRSIEINEALQRRLFEQLRQGGP